MTEATHADAFWAGDDVELLEVETGNSSAMLGMLAAETHPLMFLREYSTNGIEALAMRAEPSQPGRVVWDVDWALVQATGGRQRKLSVTDTGCGMTGDEMVALLNGIARSGKQLGASQNHGVGAKISGVIVSPAGVVYSSWRDGQGARVHFRQIGEGEEATFGLQVLRPDQRGVARYIQPLTDADKPYILKDLPHGTHVTLLGVDQDDDTTIAPEIVQDGRQRWITKALNSRYFRLPDDIEVLVREGNRFHGTDDWEAGPTTRVRGVGYFLADPGFVDAHGRVDLGDAVARWWLLNDDVKGRERHRAEWTSTGHVGVLHGNEVYAKDDPKPKDRRRAGSSLDPTRGGYSSVREFGIQIGFERVVIYIEPTVGELVPNVARTELRYRAGTRPTKGTKRARGLGGAVALPWGEWAERFRERMPRELEELQLAAVRQAGPDPQDIATKLLDGTGLSRFILPKHKAELSQRRPPAGPTLRAELDEVLPAPGTPPPPAGDSGPLARGSDDGETPHAHSNALGTGSEGGSALVTYDTTPDDAPETSQAVGAAATLVEDAPAVGEPAVAEQQKPDEEALAEQERQREEEIRQELLERMPNVVWVTMKDGSRPPGDLEDQAARLEPTSGLLTINADFRGYTVLLEEMLDTFGGSSPAAPIVVENEVRRYYLRQVLEAIVKARSLEGSGRWTDNRVEEEMLTPGALTLLLLTQHGIIGEMRKSLAQTLGKLRR